MALGLNPGGGQIFHTCPDQLLGLAILMYDEYQFSLPGVKQLGHNIEHPHPHPPI